MKLHPSKQQELRLPLTVKCFSGRGADYPQTVGRRFVQNKENANNDKQGHGATTSPLSQKAFQGYGPASCSTASKSVMSQSVQHNPMNDISGAFDGG